MVSSSYIIYIPIVVSIASLAISAATFLLNAIRAKQDRAAQLARFKYEYGKDIQPRMSFFTNYKDDCQRNKMTYTDAFRQHRNPDDRSAEEARGILAGWWGQVVELHKAGLIPFNFFLRDNKLWLQRAHNYRVLVEPIDRANYDRLGFAAESGQYDEDDNRPIHYVYIEALEEKHSFGAQGAGEQDPLLQPGGNPEGHAGPNQTV